MQKLGMLDPSFKIPPLTLLQGYKFKSGSVKVAPSAAKPKDSCSHWYPGHRPFQAPEVNNIALYIESLPTFDAFVDLRSYGQMRESDCSTPRLVIDIWLTLHGIVL